MSTIDRRLGDQSVQRDEPTKSPMDRVEGDDSGGQTENLHPLERTTPDRRLGPLTRRQSSPHGRVSGGASSLLSMSGVEFVIIKLRLNAI
jgi:hypothetical protein